MNEQEKNEAGVTAAVTPDPAPFKFQVKRSGWYRGLGGFGSYLETSDGRMCCLGFYAKALGHEDSIIDISELSGADIECPLTRKNEAGYVHETELSNRLMAVNDNRDINDDVREAELTRLFKEANIEVEFVD